MIRRRNLARYGFAATRRKPTLCIGAVALAFLLGFFTCRAGADVPLQAWASGTGPGNDFYSPATCPSACPSSHPTGWMTQGELLARPNILVIVADDQAYCQYGFMAGYCDSHSHLSCQYDSDCPAGGQTRLCRTDATGSTHDPGLGGATLRLNDPACRYRQRPALMAENNCKKNEDPDHKGHKGGDRVAYPFGRSEFPCAATDDITDHHPVYSTPHLDQLVQDGGVVFTRAYLSGNQCKTSRSSMMFGRHHRHNKWFSDDTAEADYPIADALRRFDDEPGGEHDYVRVFLGKLEVMGDVRTEAGFERGIDKSGPKLGRFKCTGTGGDDICREAACAIENGSTRCGDASGDVDDSEFPKTPRFAHDEDGNGSVDQLFDLLFRDGKFSDESGGDVIAKENIGGTDYYGITNPFFVWLAPKAPHAGGSYGAPLRDLFIGHGTKQAKHMGRVAQMDLTVGALFNELKATCVCADNEKNDPEDPTVQTTLWDHTVVLYLADHGFQLYDAKRTSNDTNNRTPLIVSHPKNRGGSPTVIDDELVSTLDVYQTILGIAGATLPPDTPEFRYGRNLKARIEKTSSAQVRKAVYAEWAQPEKTKFGISAVNTRSFYMIPVPGEVGVCENDTVLVKKPCDHDDDCPTAGSDCVKKTHLCEDDFIGHARPCLGHDDCPETSQDCLSGSTTGRCTNDPTRTCTLGGGNGQCYGTNTLCVTYGTGKKCLYSRALGTFGEHGAPTTGHDSSDTPPNPRSESSDCTTDADCIPSGAVLCQPLLLKIQADGKTNLNEVRITRAWDLRWDADQRQDLISLASDYLGTLDPPVSGRIASRMTDCLRDFWRLGDVGGEPRWVAPATSACGSWAEPPTTTTSSSTSSTTSSSTSTTSTTIP